MDQDCSTFPSNLEMANHATSYFTNIGPQLAAKIKIDNKVYLDSLFNLIEKNASLSEFPPILESELTKLLKKFDNSKSSNIPNITNKYFKDCLLCSIPQVSYLYNFILQTTSIPDTWKCASIIPIHMAGSISDISNYRLIYLIPQIVKKLEKLIHERFLTFLHHIQYVFYLVWALFFKYFFI